MAKKAKAAKKPTRKAAAKTHRKARPPASSKSKPSARKPAGKASPTTAPQTAPGGTQASVTGGSGNIRVRMYRVGFGDFFLLTVPGKNGPAHILIDCGVHQVDIGTIDQCVQDMKKETGNRLALVILTHYHADHMSGFASNYDVFANFEVGAVSITNRLDPGNANASKFMAQITSVAQQLKMQLAVRNDPSDPSGKEAHNKVENALGSQKMAGAAVVPKRCGYCNPDLKTSRQFTTIRAAIHQLCRTNSKA